jgi:hypothetical protein
MRFIAVDKASNELLRDLPMELHWRAQVVSRKACPRETEA